MAYRNYGGREGGRHHTDPTSSRFNSNTRFRQRGQGTNRPIPNRRPTGGDNVDTITVSIGRNLTTDGTNSNGPMMRGRTVSRFARPRPLGPGRHDNATNEPMWWRISIPQAGTIGKDRVMSTLKGSCARQFQPYHVS